MPNSSLRFFSLVAVLLGGCLINPIQTASGASAGRANLPNTGSAVDAQCRPGDFPVTPEVCPFRDDYNESTSQFDLGKAINMAGYVTRSHYSVLGPGGIIGQHAHKDRPCFEYILQGTATETKQDEDTKVHVRRVKQNEVERSTNGVTHWWKNETRQMVRIIAVDVTTMSYPNSWRTLGIPRKTPFSPPSKNDNIKIEDLGTIDLGQQFPGVAAARDYIMRSRRITLLPHQVTSLQSSNGQPAYTYIVRGSVLEIRSDEEASIRRPEEFSIADGGISYYWENPTSETVVLWVVDYVKRSELNRQDKASTIVPQQFINQNSHKAPDLETIP